MMTKLIATLLLPPLNLLLLASGAALMTLRWPRLGRSMLLASLICAYVMSTPAITGSWLRHLEGHPPRGAACPNVGDVVRDAAGAIVVLGGGSYFDAPEYGGNTVSDSTLVRLRWAARLHRSCGLPILVSGGSPYGNAPAEAEEMRDALRDDFALETRWVDTRSGNTYESAFYTRDILLRRENIKHIVLVTHAYHVPRATLMFERAGFAVTRAPTAFTTSPPRTILDFLPSASGLGMARTFFHETIGIGWYYFLLKLDVE